MNIELCYVTQTRLMTARHCTQKSVSENSFKILAVSMVIQWSTFYTKPNGIRNSHLKTLPYAGNFMKATTFVEAELCLLH